MKAGLLVAALAATATAQLHRRGHRHARRDNPVAYQQDVQVVTEYAKHVVYVDANGNPINPPAQNPPSAPAPAPPAYQASSPPPAYQAPPAPAPAPPAPKPAPPAPKPAPPAPKPQPYQPGSGGGQGIVYSPYNNDKTCKTQDQVTADFEKLDGYSLVRIYGCDCNQVTTVHKAATAKGMKVFIGIFDITQVAQDVQIIVAAANGDWSWVDTVSIGNELVNNGAASVGDVVNAVNSARGLLRAAGYQGPVVTVDTFVAIIANPQLCQASDYAAANCHAFFDGGKTADQAADFVSQQAQRVQQACGGKRTVITESGWPWQGASNGVAVPSKQNQATVISGLKSKFQKDIILFTAFDDLWKENFSGSHGAECYWGFVEQSA
ncbi:glycoside hydrolase family 17 protein [Cercospora zeae-maydis SCOH1-5]|uniref:Glycoside hydrolase family 17 protein n=1 Tax=Cercospora zeae-maydis SCOH1-5 TaxID=717836 RepID=A0A6A6F1Y6_9PEZI|nr:glycoside hydrolase family 17 protein [Cercospora zeae-maydis SCOH1-5]